MKRLLSKITLCVYRPQFNVLSYNQADFTEYAIPVCLGVGGGKVAAGHLVIGVGYHDSNDRA